MDSPQFFHRESISLIKNEYHIHYKESTNFNKKKYTYQEELTALKK